MKIRAILGASILLVSGQVGAAIINTPVTGIVSLSTPDSLGSLTATVDFGFLLNSTDIQQTVGGSGDIHFGEFLFEARVDFGADTLEINEAFRIQSPTGGHRTNINSSLSYFEYTDGVSSGNWLYLVDGVIEFNFIPFIKDPLGSFIINGSAYAQAPVVDVSAFSIQIINNPNYPYVPPPQVPQVPVPAAVWLFGTGIIGLIGFSKRSKAA